MRTFEYKGQGLIIIAMADYETQAIHLVNAKLKEQKRVPEVIPDMMQEVTPLEPQVVATVLSEEINEYYFDQMERLEKMLNTPEVNNFLEGVKIEAAHQTERWTIEKEEREPPHHYILVATKLLGKLSTGVFDMDKEKFKHHCITLAAVMHNLHRQIEKPGTVIHNYFNQ